MIIKIYRVITETGYTEFRDQQAAIDFAQGRLIEEEDREIPDGE